MPRFAANLSMLFSEHSFLERFGAAAGAGFEAVEYLFPYDFAKEELAERLAAHGLTQALFNLPPGDWAAGERGIAGLPGREGEFQDSVGLALDYARALGCKRLHVMAGLCPEGADRERHLTTYSENLRFAAEAFAPFGIMALVETLNSRDVPSYLLPRLADARQVIAAAARPNIALQFDFYHVQIMEGDLARRFEENLERIGHVQIAGVPGRHEPDVGELHYPYLFQRMDELGYRGWVGCEYRPRAGTLEGLGWLKR
jgi:hydroxypyruvate isomerase